MSDDVKIIHLGCGCVVAIEESEEVSGEEKFRVFKNISCSSGNGGSGCEVSFFIKKYLAGEVDLKEI